MRALEKLFYLFLPNAGPNATKRMRKTSQGLLQPGILTYFLSLCHD